MGLRSSLFRWLGELQALSRGRGSLNEVRLALPLLLLLLAPVGASAGTADVLAAKVRCRPAPGDRPASVCSFSVSIRHADTGWDHYANRFEIVGPEGAVLATRILRHPHVDEQPFTRNLGGVRVQNAVSEVEIRAGDLVHGLGGEVVTVEVPHEKRSKEPAGESPAP